MNIKKCLLYVFIGAIVFKILLILIFQYAPLSEIGVVIAGRITVKYDPVSVWLSELFFEIAWDGTGASPPPWMLNTGYVIIVLTFALQCLLLTFLIYGIVHLFKRK